MDTRELIRRLYDEGTDVSDLERDLDAETLSELRRLSEAKQAMDSLPGRRPPRMAIDAVKAHAANESPRASRMTLLLNSQVVRSFAAAAAIVVAVGLGYLTIPPAQLDPARSSELAGDAKAVESEGRANTRAKAELADREEPTAPAEQPEQLAAAPAFDNEDDDALGLALRDELMEVAETPIDELNTFGWDDEQDIRTFYWQVQALSERSPDDEWEESVPLEGSFETIRGTRRDPGWLEASSKTEN